MDERPEGGADLPDGPEGEPVEPPFEDASGPPIIGIPADSAAGRELAGEAAEIRRMVDAGAGSPEAIRELAERLREHRAREEALWRAEVRPGLVAEGKGRFRGHRKPAAERSDATISNSMTVGLALIGLVLLVIVAANSSILVLLLPVVGLLVYAWTQGRDGTDT